MTAFIRAGGFALALLFALPAHADALQDRLLAAARATPEQAFTRTSRMEERSGGAPEVHTRVERYDPARPEGQRWTLVSVDAKPPTSKDLGEYKKFIAKAVVPGYARLARWIGARAATDGRAYRYASLPKDIMVINGHDLSADTTAEAFVNTAGPTPFVERTRLVSAKGFRMMLVAKVDRVEASQHFRLVGDRPLLVESIVELTGSMMGKSGSMKTTATFSYTPAR